MVLDSDLEALNADPINLFESWFLEAKKTKGIEIADAVVLSTASTEGMPSGRVVLLKGVDARGFVFYTNYHSRKAEDLEKNPKASLTFF